MKKLRFLFCSALDLHYFCGLIIILNMKNKVLILLAVVLSLGGSISASAQDFESNEEPKNEISLGYGFVSSSNALDVFADAVSAIFGARYKNGAFIGPLSAEYFYHVSPLVGVGGIGVYTHHEQDVVQNEEVTGKRNSNYYTIMPAVILNWLRKSRWGMYSKLGAGYTRGNYSTTGKDSSGNDTRSTSNNNFFNFQVSLVGIEAGNRSVRGFAELGFGEQGLIHGGIRFRF